MSSYPPNGTHVDVTIIDWVLTDGCTHSLLAVDNEERTYIHWLPDDKRWESSWKKYIGKINLKAVMRCGKKEGPRGLTSYMVDIVIPKPEQPPILDVEGGKKLDAIVGSIDRHILETKPGKKRKGDCSFTVSLPNEEERILVNAICEKARAEGLVKAKGHYPGQFLKAWLLEQAIRDGLLGL